MSTGTRVQADDERALRWLQRRLEWEATLAALRDASAGRRVDPPAADREPAAA